jgi:hypothetical protein
MQADAIAFLRELEDKYKDIHYFHFCDWKKCAQDGPIEWKALVVDKVYCYFYMLLLRNWKTPLTIANAHTEMEWTVGRYFNGKLGDPNSSIRRIAKRYVEVMAAVQDYLGLAYTRAVEVEA